jgi:nitrogen fixation protein NifU and related proteins
MDIYIEEVIDHAKNPRNFGELSFWDISSSSDNEMCGDRVQIFARTKGEEILEIGWKGRGCAICMAAASLLSEIILREKDLSRLHCMTSEEILGQLGMAEITATRRRCALLAWEAFREMVKGYKFGYT